MTRRRGPRIGIARFSGFAREPSQQRVAPQQLVAKAADITRRLDRALTTIGRERTQGTAHLADLTENLTLPSDSAPIPIAIDANARVDAQAKIVQRAPRVSRLTRHDEVRNGSGGRADDIGGRCTEVPHREALTASDPERLEATNLEADGRQAPKLLEGVRGNVGADHQNAPLETRAEPRFREGAAEAVADPLQEVSGRKHSRRQQGIPVERQHDQHGRTDRVARDAFDEPQLPTTAVESFHHQSQATFDLLQSP